MPAPRVVIVTRETEVQSLRRSYGTVSNAANYLSTHSASNIMYAEDASVKRESALDTVIKAIPEDWRHTRVFRHQLDRFVFEPNDFVVTVGLDGLVPNVAKYLDGQYVVGFLDNPGRSSSVLARFSPNAAQYVIPRLATGAFTVERRTLASATLDDGQELVGLNEIFIGHESHQSARYRLSLGGGILGDKLVLPADERQSSSGVIVSTGTGATGWASSIARAYHHEKPLPKPTDDELYFFVREPWLSPETPVRIVEGRVSGDQSLVLSSEIEEGGVIFSDGMEIDCFQFTYGRSVEITPAKKKLNLVVNV